MVILTVLLLLIFIPLSTWWFGLWSNFLTLINFFMSALIASSFYENIATKMVKNTLPDYRGIVDFLALWILFAASFVVFRLVTDIMSKHVVVFDYWTEMIGRTVLSLWIALAFISFTLFSFHLAPLHPDAIQKNADDVTLGIGPDRMWMAFIQSRSRGALSASKKGNFSPLYNLPTHPDDVELDARVFDPFGGFIEKWQAHRLKMSKQNGFKD